MRNRRLKDAEVKMLLRANELLAAWLGEALREGQAVTITDLQDVWAFSKSQARQEAPK